MPYPAPLRQPAWVLQSGSADQPGPEQLRSEPTPEAQQAWTLIEPGWRALQAGDRPRAEQLWRQALRRHPHNLLLLRTLNSHAPALIRQPALVRRRTPLGQRIAVLLPGELRGLAHSGPFLQALARRADLFICTSTAWAAEGRSLPGQLQLVDPEPDLPMGAMQQWHKLALALAMVRRQEECTGRRYTHILKLRSDFLHARPQRLLTELVTADGLICASDKVFGGRRELMLLFEGFHAAIAGWFDQREQLYWPINTAPILRSDDSSKWYGMAFPRELVGQPSSVSELRAVLAQGGEALAEALLRWRPPAGSDGDDLYWRLFQGHPRFASEVCFARFLNFNAIPSHCSPGLMGFLRSDRLQR